jgi:peptidoglycan-N-acetylglucosamine deacetylase
MMFYIVKKPTWFRWLLPGTLWEVKTAKKELYLTFDDGPHPVATPFILEQLQKYDAKGTFFCLGGNVQKYKQLYDEVISEGHSVGNHSYSHLDGWRSDSNTYVNDVLKASTIIHSPLFRPPYGHIRRNAVKTLKQLGFKTVIWTVLAGDFDSATTGEKCFKNVITNTKAGSIIVFHDNDIALCNLRYSLPRVLQYFTDKGYTFKGLPAE